MEPKNIRNIAILGHQSSGKTSLVESLAFRSGLIQTKGSIEKQNTLSDCLEDEKKKQSSISSSIISLSYNDIKLNLIDIPGNDDFIFETLGITKIIKGAILVIDASSGIQTNTIKHFKLLRKRGVPTFIFINKMDKENIDYPSLFKDIQEQFGKQCAPFSYPLGKKDSFDGFVNIVELKARRYNGQTCVDDVIHDDKKQTVYELYNRLCEAVATTSDELLDKFFLGEKLSSDEIRTGLKQGVLSGDLIPVVVGSALKDIGTNTLLKMLVDFLPSPTDLKSNLAYTEAGKEVDIPTTKEEAPSLYVFKTTYDQFQGLNSIFKVNSGSIKVGDELYCPNNKKTYKITNLNFICGDKLTSTDEVVAGDIACVTRLEGLQTTYTLTSPKRVIKYPEVKYPSATYFKAVVCATKKDSDKLYPSLEKLMLKDPTICLKENSTTNQILVGGLNASHLSYVFEQLKNVYKVDFSLDDPKIVYKETITKEASAEGRYVKQSGGSGYYGVVNMTFKPSEDTSFESTVFGGHIDKGYFPAVEKGFLEAMNQGSLIGAPVINVKAILTDGKQHSVDSNEMAFKQAAILAFRQAYENAKPIILEPYDKITVNVTSEYLGVILSDMTKRRGKILSTEEDKQGNFDIVALVPEAEILDYSNELKSLTKGSGFFNLEFNSYERTPDVVQQKIIENYKKSK